MAQQIIWSEKAIDDVINIFDYWQKRNKSNSYNKKLNILFNNSIDIISRHPSIGKSTHIKNIKVKTIKDYLIIYEITPELIFILSILDSRRNPEELNKLISKKY